MTETQSSAQNLPSVFSDQEIRRLKELASARVKWWRNYPLVVSVLAFLLSLATSGISIYSSYQKDIHDRQAELSVALRTLQELNLKQIELHEKYKGSAEESAATSLISNQIYNTTLLAGDIALGLGINATTATLLPLSQRTYHYDQYTKAEKMAQLALDVAQSIEDEVGALRWQAFMKIRTASSQSIQDGNTLFLKSFNAEKKYNLSISSKAKIGWIKAGTKLQWADALAPINCGEAQKHFFDGINILNSSTRSLGIDRLRGLAAQKYKIGIGGVPSCSPTPETELRPATNVKVIPDG